MAWRTLALPELLSGPVAWWWWKDHHRLGARTAARKMFLLSQSIAEQTTSQYLNRFVSGLRAYEYTSSGWPVTTFFSLTLALKDADQGYFSDVAQSLPEDELRLWWARNDSGINDLTQWFVTVRAMSMLFSQAPLCLSLDFDSTKLIVYPSPSDAGMAYANCAVGLRQHVVNTTTAIPFAGLNRTVSEMGWRNLLLNAGLPISV